MDMKLVMRVAQFGLAININYGPTHRPLYYSEDSLQLCNIKPVFSEL